MWTLQTYYYDPNGEQLGFNRQAQTREELEQFARENLCGSRYEISEIPTKEGL